MIFILKYLMYQIVYLHIQACADWELLTKPVVFGEKVQLACTAKETEIPLDQPHSRSWSGGPYSHFLSLNGVVADPTKYKAIHGKDKSQYILEISSFSESDVDCEYKCIVGLDEARKTLYLNEDDYEYIPTQENTTVTASFKNGRFSVNVHLAKVWPTPVCDIVFAQINYRKQIEMTKKKNGKLYSVDIYLQLAIRKKDCSRRILISCQIGTKHIEFQRKLLNTCPVTDRNKDGNVLNESALIALVIAVIMFLVMIFVVMISLIVKDKGYSFSNFDIGLGYTWASGTEIPRNKEPFLKDTSDNISLRSQNEHSF